MTNHPEFRAWLEGFRPRQVVGLRYDGMAVWNYPRPKGFAIFFSEHHVEESYPYYNITAGRALKVLDEI